MIPEVSYGIVDSSAAGSLTDVGRHEFVDFSPAIVPTVIGLIIRTPEKSEQVSFLSRK